MDTVNLQSLRARKARLGKALHGKDGVLGALSALLALGGTGLLSMQFAGGWLVFALALWLFMLVVWYKLDLCDIAVGAGGSVEDRLESPVLGVFAAQPTPKHIAAALERSASARFVMIRLGLPHSAMVEFSSDNVEDAAAVWQKAEVYRQQLNESIIRGSTLVAALCATQNQLKGLLPHAQLEVEDVVNGAAWFTRIQQIIDEDKVPKPDGGIARDWNFGYANLLERFGTNISQQVAHGGLLHVKLDSHISILQQLQDVFSKDGRQNVALVGKLGAGKSTVVQAFAQSLQNAKSQVAASIKFRQIIRLDAGALIRAARNRNELEGLVQQLFIEAFQAKNIILFLDDAQLFFEDGNGSVDLASTLLPILDGGRLRILLAMDEQAYLRIAQRDPALTSVLNRLNVPTASESETMAVMQDQVLQIESEQKVTISFQALKEAYRLSERYQHEIAQPGRAVRLLEQAARHAENGYVTADSVASAIEQSSGVKVARVADNTAERDTLLNMEKLIHERMVNQTRAVAAVSDALRRARAGVRNEKRPVGTFLFLGPTGVGKTELAKALAAVYFGGEDHLVRVDLNEYVRPEDVARLIADGAEDPHSLTASVMKQPFSVVLLDEIEKAHPQVLTTLLQMLDEGILRDINNREVGFRDAVVIATSNAGADQIRKRIDEGQQLEEFESDIVNELIDSQQFRPEFLNRFDEIVVFRPLTEAELGQVVEGMIKQINATLAPQKVQVVLTPGAITKLAQTGYDPRLGARPMRRVVQRSVENLVAKMLLDGSVQAGQTVTISEENI
ncbi:MAG: AAA family ATPase [Candidatus Saccharimonadales bacterium]